MGSRRLSYNRLWSLEIDRDCDLLCAGFLTLQWGQYNSLHGIMRIKLGNMPSKEYIFGKDRAHFLILIGVLLNMIFAGTLSGAVKNNSSL